MGLLKVFPRIVCALFHSQRNSSFFIINIQNHNFNLFANIGNFIWIRIIVCPIYFRHMYQPFNLLLYLNKDWNPQWGGNLELWDPDVVYCGKSISPKFNRCVLFLTNDKSCHGHPTKLDCPIGESRKSIALYYFRENDTNLTLTPTKYRSLPGDTISKQFFIAVDTGMVRLYSFLRRHLRFHNKSVSQILKYLKKY